MDLELCRSSSWPGASSLQLRRKLSPSSDVHVLDDWLRRSGTDDACACGGARPARTSPLIYPQQPTICLARLVATSLVSTSCLQAPLGKLAASRTSWSCTSFYKMFPAAARPAQPLRSYIFLVLLFIATTATVMLLAALVISLCAGVLPACVAQQAPESSYTVSSGFPTSLFSSYYIEPASTQEVLTLALSRYRGS
jgi:hypothetical protein